MLCSGNLRSVVADDEARPLRVVVLDIAFDDLNKVFSVSSISGRFF